MKKTERFRTDFYTSGQYIIEAVHSKGKFNAPDVEYWISKPSEYAHKMYIFGVSITEEYPESRQLEILEANLPEYKRAYEEEVALICEAYDRKFYSGRC